GGGPGPGGVLDRAHRVVGGGNERRAAGDETGSVPREEGVERRRGHEASGPLPRRALDRRRQRQLVRPLRQYRAGERQHPVDENVEPDAEDDADALRLWPQVRGPDAEGRGSAAGAREAAEGRAARTVVAR